MYRYDEFDHAFVRERVAEFRAQVERRLSGALTEDGGRWRLAGLGARDESRVDL